MRDMFSLGNSLVLIYGGGGRKNRGFFFMIPCGMQSLT